MTEPFLISETELRALSATRQGRVSVAGYNYQAAYAVARLVAMSVQQPVLGLEDWPKLLRYDWGEDLDEARDDGTVIFTQCKRRDKIGEPSTLADVLIGLAPKWLLVPAAGRGRVRFRLVCPDPRLGGRTSLNRLKAEVHSHFRTKIEKPAGARSDRARWKEKAADVGAGVLFEALWSQFDSVYLPADVATGPAGSLLFAEREALRVLLEWGRIEHSGLTQVLMGLRLLIHDNLIRFDPTDESFLPPFDQSPRCLDRADVNAAIYPHQPKEQRQSLLRLVDRTFLSTERKRERQQFVARQPYWSDVVHGPDSTIKFIERDQTQALETKVLEEVVARIGRSAKLPTLFVVGAPGAGKTTIVRRVAARLVNASKLLIADTGVDLREPPGEPDEYVRAVESLQSFGRPVVLLLDDPLYAESPWLDVLRRLNRPGLQIGVLAASPRFLFDEHKSKLHGYDLSTFEMEPTTRSERESLAALYRRPVSTKTEEDFLVVAMEMASGDSFREIISRLWRTLADNRDLSSARCLSDLPWLSRAYLFVCFFARAYEACPEPLLLELLNITGGVPGVPDVGIELRRLKGSEGWNIFRVGDRPRASLSFLGTPISAAHAVIARQAWKQRPLAQWCDENAVGALVIDASVLVPKSVYDLSRLAVRLASTSFLGVVSSTEGKNFATNLVKRWRTESSVETRYLCDLVTTILWARLPELIHPLRDVLINRAVPGPQGWLAALSLLQLYKDSDHQQIFPAEVDLLSLIQSADFSVAPNRAAKFGIMLKGNEPLREAFVARLLHALAGKLPWTPNTQLLGDLLVSTPPAKLTSHIPLIKAWLEDHPDDTNVRRQYLAFLRRHPVVTAGLRADAAWQTALWLEAHLDTIDVRVEYLTFLLELPVEFSGLLVETARRMRMWLQHHVDDVHVRAKYMHFLSQIPYSQAGSAGTMSIDEWQQLAGDTLKDTVEIIVRLGWQLRHDALVKSITRLHRQLFLSLRECDSEFIRRTLYASYGAQQEWFRRNPTNERQPRLHVPPNKTPPGSRG